MLVGFGAVVPTTDYKDVANAKLGYQILGGLEYPFLAKSTSIRFDGTLGWNGRETDTRESNYLASINARLVWWIPAKLGSVSPYALAGVGYLYNKYLSGQSVRPGTSHSEGLFSAGIGAEIPVGPVTTFAEGRYDYGADVTRVYPFVVGIRFKPGT
jgi:hypothetical protein